MKILVVDDEAESIRSIELLLRISGFPDVCCMTNANEALAKIDTEIFDVCVFDIIMPVTGGVDLLRKVKQESPDTVVIMSTGVQDIQTAIECMRLGAADYLLKPLDDERLLAAIRNACTIRELQNENRNLTRQLLSPDVPCSESFPVLRTLTESVTRICKYSVAIAPSSHPVLITGETGVGKELVAKGIHAMSGVKGKFVAVNVAGIDDTVFSDTLFGHVKGAFTGADSYRKGLVETAAEGTLFLDEIGDLSMSSQTKLLRLLQEKEYFPLGTDIPQSSSARIITATCKNINQIESNTSFRRDLFYRLRTHLIEVPPLRDRKDDIPLLVDQFVKNAAEEFGKPTILVPNELYTLLNLYHFPGNIRELQSMVFDAVSIQKGNTLALDVFLERTGLNRKKDVDHSVNKSEAIDCSISFHDPLPTIKECENMLVHEALRRTGGNQSMAAHLLGITRQALNKRVKNASEEIVDI